LLNNNILPFHSLYDLGTDKVKLKVFLTDREIEKVKTIIVVIIMI